MDWVIVGELFVILLLILLNGYFAAAEIAILTARRGRLEQQASNGDRGAKVALELAADADRFLPTVQVGITLVGTFAGVFGGSHLAGALARSLARWPNDLIAENSNAIALSLVTLFLAFLSLVLGELVPKRIALQHAEPFATWMARPMRLLQRLTTPFVWVLRMCTRTILQLLGQKATVQVSVSVDDIQHLIETGTQAGLLEQNEQRMAIEALRFGDRTVSEILRPRIEIDALDINTPGQEVLGAIVMSGFSRIPVCDGTIDKIVGFIYIKDVLMQLYCDRPIDVERLVRPPLFVPKNISIGRLLELFRQQRTQLAIVLDEYGGTQGMVTMEDVLEILVGDIHDEHRIDQEQAIVKRDDGSLLVDASVFVHELEEQLGVTRWPTPPPRGVGSVSGLFLALIRRPPKVGDAVDWNRFRFEVVDMDGPRIDRLLVSPLGDAGEPTGN